MSSDLITFLTQGSPIVAVVLLFVWHLDQREKRDEEKDKRNTQAMKEFRAVIERHLEKAEKVQRETNEINQTLTSEVKELSRIIKELYKRLLDKNREIKSLKEK